MTGDTGTGGTDGLVPAPPAGSAAAGKFLKADGTWQSVLSIGGVAVKTVNYTAVGTDVGILLTFNSGSAIQLTLPAAPPSSSWFVAVQDIGIGVLTINRNGLNIDGVASNLTLNQNSGLFVFTDGTNYFTERGSVLPASVTVGIVGITIDGGGTVPTTGLKGLVQIPYACTITGWSIIADQSGAASVDIWALAGSAPPTTPSIPVSANKISASAPVALSSAQSAAGGTTAISTWTKPISQWMTVAFNLSSITTCNRIAIELQVIKT
jgi:hypothetical protein